MPRNDDEVMLHIRVTLHPNDEIANRTRCPIANSIKDSNPSEFMHTDATRDYIAYTRRSTGTRFRHWTPKSARSFIKKLDELAKKDPDKITRADLPRPFDLILHASTLESETPVGRTTKPTTARSRNQMAMTQKLKVKAPARQPRTGSRSRRSIPTVN